MRDITGSIEGEWRRYKVLGEGALRQVRDDQLCYSAGGDNNSIAVIVRHLAGNLKSRFTDFLTADGEKPWRDRDSEFQSLGTVSRAEVLKQWDEGWAVLFEALEGLTDDDLSRLVTIRGEKFRVHEALLRLVAHTSYHDIGLYKQFPVWKIDREIHICGKNKKGSTECRRQNSRKNLLHPGGNSIIGACRSTSMSRTSWRVPGW